MAHGCSRSKRTGGPHGFVAGIAFLILLALSGATGPADSVAKFGRLAVPTPTVAKIRVQEVNPLPAPADMAALPVEDARAEMELLHETTVFDTMTVRIAPEALVRQKKRVVMMEVTAYCACKKCCGSAAMGITASGRRTSYNGGHFVAADIKLLPFGTKMIVPGYADGNPVEVIDRGGAIRGNHIDLFMPTHQQAVEWGKRRLLVTIFDKEGD